MVWDGTPGLRLRTHDGDRGRRQVWQCAHMWPRCRRSARSGGHGERRGHASSCQGTAGAGVRRYSSWAAACAMHRCIHPAQISVRKKVRTPDPHARTPAIDQTNPHVCCFGAETGGCCVCGAGALDGAQRIRRMLLLGRRDLVCTSSVRPKPENLKPKP